VARVNRPLVDGDVIAVAGLVDAELRELLHDAASMSMASNYASRPRVKTLYGKESKG
jgi:hypothetical protein